MFERSCIVDIKREGNTNFTMSREFHGPVQSDDYMYAGEDYGIFWTLEIQRNSRTEQSDQNFGESF